MAGACYGLSEMFRESFLRLAARGLTEKISNLTFQISNSKVFTEDQLLPLSALQHWLFCPRQCALIHLEQVWAENRFTAEGQVLHHKAHEGADESKAGVRITRSMAVRSLVLGVSGQCDIVEFHPAGGDLGCEISDLRNGGRGDLRCEISDLRNGGRGDLRCEISDLRGKDPEDAEGPTPGKFKSQVSNLKCTARAVPVEYKRGKPKAHRADEVQLCAQAMCLEEMLDVAISNGYVYYGEKRRRTEVVFDTALRQLVADTAAALHAMIDSRETPLAAYESRRCDACSLIDLCQPKALRFKKGAAAWFSSALKSQI
jgi:CRISPR-associated exonuclease Cas4